MGYKVILINNYTDDCREDMRNTNIGSAKAKLLEDNNGVITGNSESLVGSIDGRYITLPLDTPKDYPVISDISKIEGDSTLLTITLVDGTVDVIETE